MLRQNNKIFIRDNMSKVKISRLSDKMYIFSNGITTLPHGHDLLKPIYDAGEGKSTEELQSDEHIALILELEKAIELKHERLRLTGLFYTQNEHIYL